VSAGTQNAAAIYGIVGKSGSGKGLCVKGELIKRWRGAILVWSPIEDSDNYTEVIKGVVCRTIAEVVSAIQHGHKRVVLRAGESGDMKAQFDRFCRIAWELVGWMIVVEELSQVTKASWAPQSWKKLTTAGRHRGLTIIGVCQRPAQVDKDFFGNCSTIRCYKVGFMADAKSMADVMFCTPADILALEKFHYIERNVDENTNRTGVAKVPKR
jgi:hypothetical protein